MTCDRGDHRAPRTGGSCPCGVVTYVPAPPTPVCPTCSEAAVIVDRLDLADGIDFYTVAGELADLVTRGTR